MRDSADPAPDSGPSSDSGRGPGGDPADRPGHHPFSGFSGRPRWPRRGVLPVLTALALAAAALPWVAAPPDAGSSGVSMPVRSAAGEQVPGHGPDASPVYAVLGGQPERLDVWRSPHPTSGRPGVLWVHGGAWTTGRRGENPARNRWLAAHGFTVFDVDYRLAPQTGWNAQTGDVRCALGWVYANAARFGVDPRALSLGGDSAGGNLAMLAAYTQGTAALPPSCAAPDVPLRSVLSFYGPTDTTTLVRDSRAPTLTAKVERQYFGGTAKEFPGRYRTTSPVTYVRPGLPPTLLIQGAADHVVPSTQATELGGKLAAVGVPHQVVMLPQADHVFDARWDSPATRTAYAALAQFLDRHGH